MALIVMTEMTVQYACRLSVNDEQKVREYANQENITLEDAVDALYGECAINLYADSWESDCYGTTILNVDEEYT